MNNESGGKNQQARNPPEQKQAEQPNPKSRQKSGGHTGSKDAGNSDDAPSKSKHR